jgi:hypothetical protein
MVKARYFTSFLLVFRVGFDRLRSSFAGAPG